MKVKPATPGRRSRSPARVASTLTEGLPLLSSTKLCACGLPSTGSRIHLVSCALIVDRFDLRIVARRNFCATRHAERLGVEREILAGDDIDDVLDRVGRYQLELSASVNARPKSPVSIALTSARAARAGRRRDGCASPGRGLCRRYCPTRAMISTPSRYQTAKLRRARPRRPSPLPRPARVRRC